MKKFLLSIGGLLCIGAIQAQIYLNEVYVQPNHMNHEFVELHNAGTTPASVGCYTLVTYFNDAGTRGFYVIDFPDITIAAQGYLVASSTNPWLNYQNGQAQADVDWNDGNISRYVWTGTTLQLDNTGAPYHDIFTRAGISHKKNGPYAIFLFNGNALVDGLLAASVNHLVPDFIQQLGTLTHITSQGCGNLTFDFSTLSNSALVSNVQPTAGTDNGYFRAGNGPCPNNNNWLKASTPAQHTPGMPNPPAPGNSGQGNASALAVNAECVTSTTVSYSITGGPASVYPLTVTLYHDMNGNGMLDAGETQLDQATYFHNSGQLTLNKPAAAQFLVLVIDAEGICFDMAIGIQCQAGIGLPVTLRSFTAKRIHSDVLLNWTTSMEANNHGFEIQRKTGSNEWEMIGFVATRAQNGNSDVELNYSFSDQNNINGVSQYRLRQLDLDGRYSFSEIRSVRGQGQNTAMLVYPNPSSDGLVNVVFDAEEGQRDIMVLDMSGRTIRQWNGITNNNLQIGSLMPGVYSLRVYNRLTGEISVEKVVVSKH